MTDVRVLISKLGQLMAQHRMAYDVTWKYPEYSKRVAEAKLRMAKKEQEVEQTVKTWVYDDLINELKATEAHRDGGHFYHEGVEFVIDLLEKYHG
jgi:hypothetical protein